MSGLHFWRVDGRTLVHSVDADSPAANAGIKADDQILAVNGRKAEEAGLAALRNLLKSGDERQMEVRIRRGDGETVLMFRLKKRL